MSQSLRPLSLLLMAALSLSCHRLSNAFSEVKLECGPDAESGLSYVQVLDPRGESLDGSQLVVRRLAASGVAEDIAPTSKACVALQDEPLIVTSLKAEIPWGKVIRREDLPSTRQIRLQDVRSEGLKVSCPANPHLNHKLENPLRAQPEDPAFPYSLRIVQGDISVSTLDELQLQGEIGLPGALRDGPFSLVIDYRNLYEPNLAALQQAPLVCDYILDRTVPEPEDSLEETLAEDTFKVLPGETISLSLSDENAEAILYCLEAEGRRCASEEDFTRAGVELSLQAPQAGRWCLHYKGRDRAGNTSELRTRCAISYQASLIENIRALADMALIRAGDDKLLATTLMLKALHRYRQLPTPEEKAALADKLLFSSLSLGSSVKERNRLLLKSFVRRAERLGPYILIYDAEGLKLFDPLSLIEHQSLPIPGAISLAVRGSRLVVGKTDGFSVFELKGNRIEEVGSMTFPSGFPAQGTFDLHPLFDEVLHFGSEGAVSVLRPINSEYRFATSLQAVAALRVVWSESGDKALLQGRNDAAVLLRTTEGTYRYDQASGYREIPPSGSAYLAARDGFVLVASDGLSLWTENEGFQPIESSALSGAALGIETSTFSDRLLATSANELLLVTTQGIFELDFTQNAPGLQKLSLPAFVQPRDIASWSFADDRLSLLSGNHLAILRKRAPEKKWILEQRFPGTDLKRIGGAYFADLRHAVTVDRDLRLVSWSDRSAFGSFAVENLDSIFLRFLQLEGEARLATAGNLGQARLWDLEGSSTAVFTHSDRTTQINELSWNQDATRFATGGEDGRVLVYDREGRVLARLDDQGQCGPEAVLRYTTLFSADGTTLVSSGSSAINVWTESEEYSALPQCMLIGSQLSESHRTVPGDLRLFPWRGRELILSTPSLSADERTLKIFELDGSPSMLGDSLPGTFSAAAFDHRQKNLAHAGRDGGLSLYALTDEGFQLMDAVGEDIIPFPAATLSWSPDDRFLAVFYPQRKLMIYEIDDGRLSLRGERALAGDGTSRYYLPQWIGGGIAYFDKAVLHILTKDLELKGKVTAFDGSGPVTAADFDEANQLLAIQKEGEVKFLPLDFSAIQNLLCREFASYLRHSSDFLEGGDWLEEDRNLCSQALLP